MANFDIDDDVKVTMGVEVSIGEYAPRGTVSITENGTHNVGGFKYADVDVEPEPQPLQSKTATPTESQQSIEPNSGYYGLSLVNINPIPSQYIVPSGTKSITVNGIGIDVTSYASVDVAVPSQQPTLITKTITENGSYNASSDSADGYSSVTVNVSSGGGGSVDSGVIFIDYDGTIVDSYTTFDVASLTALPSNPTHAGLTSQGWNWSLADIKSYLTAHPDALLTVGQMYVTSDGKTRIEIELQEGRISPYLSLAVNGEVSIDWGDNSSPTTLTGSSLSTRQDTPHVYPTAGEYVITITVTSGTAAFLGTSTYFLLHKNSGTGNENRTYANAVKNIRIGTDMSIGSYAFSNCCSLSSITIPDSVTSIGGSAFGSCYSLSSITIPDSVTSIGGSAFSNCCSLPSITIPDGVTSIGNYAFQYCRSLSSITIPDSVTSIGISVFDGCYSLSSFTIPDSVTSIGASMFYNCYPLSSITIPDSVTSIGSNVFAYCYSLVSITIPDSVTSIGGSAFQYCYSLSSITIPDSVTSIGGSAFQYCYGMAEYHFLPTTPPTLGTDVFKNIPSDCIIYVPSESIEAYKAAENWSTYASNIQGE